MPSHPYTGFLNLNKPLGWTSHDCVAKVRRLLGMKKVGHGGTLDPLATGVLPIALGRATRLIQYLPADKAYRATVRFGVRTASDDLDGEILAQTPVPDLTLERVRQHLPPFLGQIEQIPPKFSAIQVDGRRLYDLARAGADVDVPARQVEVYDLTVLGWQGGEFPELALAIACGGGTYIRAIARDLGEAVGCGATLAQLQRTASSGFSLADSVSIDKLTELCYEPDEFQPLAPERAIAHLPRVVLTGDRARRWCLGQRFPLEPPQPETECVAVFDDADRFLGVGTWKTRDGSRLFAPKLVFAGS